MGDRRYDAPYERVASAPDRAAALRLLTGEEVIMALAAASRHQDALLANVLATEAMNRTRRAHTTLENLGEGVLALDREGRIVGANPAALRALGFSRDELLGVHLHDHLHCDLTGGAVPAERCSIMQTLRTGRPHREREGIHSFRRRDGTCFPVDVTTAPLRADGETTGVVAVFRDITERHAAEAMTQHLATIVESAAEAILAADPEGIITSWNPAAERLFGWSAGEMVGERVSRIIPPEREEELQRKDVLARAHEAGTFETTRLTKDGRRIDVALTLSPLYNGDGALRGFSAIYRDITAQKAAEAAAAAAARRERDAYASARYRLATVLPALAWGLGSAVALRTLILGIVAITAPTEDDGVIFLLTTLALALGIVIGAAVYVRQRRRMEQAPRRLPRPRSRGAA